MITLAPIRLQNCGKKLAEDSRGVTVVEFALIAPVLLLMLFGLLDLGYNIWARSVLTGAVHKAARAATLESAVTNTDQLDARVVQSIRSLVPSAQLQFSRLAYESLGDVRRPEDFTDQNDNGVHDVGECFVDANRNGRWDSDRGSSGLAGPGDITRYDVTISYNRLFDIPLLNLAGLEREMSLTASTTLQVQPYGEDQADVPETVCG